MFVTIWLNQVQIFFVYDYIVNFACCDTYNKIIIVIEKKYLMTQFHVKLMQWKNCKQNI